MRTSICLLAGLAAATLAANPPNRSAPTRPLAAVSEPQPGSTPATPRAGAVASPREYVKIEDVAAHHALEQSWLQPQKRLLLKNTTTQVEIEAGSREMRVNGRKVFLGDPARLVEDGLRVSRIDNERLLTGLLQPGQDRWGELKAIAIDPGHGGPLPGTLNAKLGLQEKQLALDVSIRLKKLLEALGYRVIMTRETDIDVSWGARAILANQAKADLFISVHFNASPRPGDTETRGSEVFTFAPQFQRSTDSWGNGKPDDTEALPAPVNRFDVASAACAQAIHRALLVSLESGDRGQKIAHLGVLRPLNCPGVLVEAGFLSSEVEGKKIATPEYRQRIAEAIADGVKAYAALVSAGEK